MGGTSSNLLGNYYYKKTETALVFDVKKIDQDYEKNEKERAECDRKRNEIFDNYKPPMDIFVEKLDTDIKNLIATRNDNTIKISRDKIGNDAMSAIQMFQKQYPKLQDLNSDDKGKITNRTCQEYKKFVENINKSSKKIRICVHENGYPGNMILGCEFVVREK